MSIRKCPNTASGKHSWLKSNFFYTSGVTHGVKQAEAVEEPKKHLKFGFFRA